MSEPAAGLQRRAVGEVEEKTTQGESGLYCDGEGLGASALNFLEPALTTHEHMSAAAAKTIIDRLSGGKRKAK